MQFIFKPMTPDDTDALVRTVFGEARNQSLDGSRAVTCVIRNRAVLAFAYEKAHGKPHPLFGDGSIYAVCHAPLQFSCWNKDDPNRKIIEAVPSGGGVYGALKKHVIEWLNQGDNTDGSTHYCTKAIAPETKWTKGKTPAVVIGAHYFYNNID